jgi:hypothetical protein
MSKDYKNKEDKIEDYSKATLRDIFTKAGLNSDLTERAIEDYKRYREGELSFLDTLSGDEIRQIGAEALADKIMTLKKGRDIVDIILRDYLWYLDNKKEIVETYQESNSWDEVLNTVVYVDARQSQEAFIDCIEEIYQTKVKDSKHLQKLTGCKEYRDSDKIKLQDVINNARYCKYERVLEKKIKEGAKYKDLLNIEPKDFNLPESWGSYYNSPANKYNTILKAIGYEFMINEPASLMLLPDLRSIAEELEAPYSVIMDSYNLVN